jgi:hypothetical protein
MSRRWSVDQINTLSTARRCALGLREADLCGLGRHKKHQDGNRPGANLRDYAAVRAAFTWGSARELAMDSDLNIAYWALDPHAVEGRGDRVALLCHQVALSREGRIS